MANTVFSYFIFYFYVFKQEILPHILASGWSLTFLHSSTLLDSVENFVYLLMEVFICVGTVFC